MAEQVTLAIQRRDVLGKRVRQLRRRGIVPANIYGHGRDSRAVQVNALDLKRLLASHAGSRLVRLRLDGTDEPALMRHIAHEPVTGEVLHIDFMHVELTEKIRARVPVRLMGEAPAVRNLDGTLLHMADAVEVECLPQNLPEALELDISRLAQLDDVLYARDLPVPEGVELLTDPEEPIVKVAAPRAVEEVAPVAPAEAPAEEAAEATTESAADSEAE